MALLRRAPAALAALRPAARRVGLSPRPPLAAFRSPAPPVQPTAALRGLATGGTSRYPSVRAQRAAQRAARGARIAHERGKTEASKITIVVKDPSTGTTHEITSLGQLHTVGELLSAAAAELGTEVIAKVEEHTYKEYKEYTYKELRLAFKNEPLSSNSRTLGSCGMEEGSEVVALPAQLTPEEAVRASISLIPSRGPDSRP